jgi:hypothetical protein
LKEERGETGVSGKRERKKREKKSFGKSVQK